MRQEIHFATFNVRNLALPGAKYYDNQEPYTLAEYDAKVSWIAQQIDRLNADVIGFQEIFSQQALKDVLARSQHYRQAHHLGFDPDPRLPLTPSVALVSKLPLIEGTNTYAELPRNLAVTLPDAVDATNRFTRPVLHARVAVSSELVINVFVVHLKSKRPDFNNGENDDDPYHLGIASLRSLIKRGTEALGLRYLLTDAVQDNRVPLVVMGDFNDVATAVSTQLVMGAGRHGKTGFDDRLFDSYLIQSRHDPVRNVGFSSVHEGSYETIDHILVSEEFNPASRFAIGEVTEVLYLNDHVALRQPETSDHGQVLVRIRLYGAANGNGDGMMATDNRGGAALAPGATGDIAPASSPASTVPGMAPGPITPAM
ncbi:endonuclease/exonuclease/phosphatase family protein [Undibacterium arcticum]|uniref:Endonuclease/exonuclease/phosphatase family protein n=1 Tax=Undibacterium arcticum TaxID=1762892 RepID=A0ABV7EYA9_9BURK